MHRYVLKYSELGEIMASENSLSDLSSTVTYPRISKSELVKISQQRENHPSSIDDIIASEKEFSFSTKLNDLIGNK